jgi:hypothetical protein
LRKGRTLVRRWKRGREMGKEKHPRTGTRARRAPTSAATCDTKEGGWRIDWKRGIGEIERR